MAIASFDLADLDGNNGFALNGINENDASGYSVSGAGDVNGDGIDDLIIGAPDADPNGSGSGQSYVIFGSNGGFDASLELSELDGSNGFVINGIFKNDRSGRSVSGAGDVNGDGFDDLIIGAPYAYADQNTPFDDYDAGQSYVVFGSDGGFDASLEQSDLDGNNGFAINARLLFDNSGRSVSGAGDVNGDGFDDLIIGAPYAISNRISSSYYYAQGESYVVFGADGGFPADLELSDLDGSNGFKVEGPYIFARFGGSVSGAGDINGDGFDDLIAGSRFSNRDNSLYYASGQSYVIFGSNEGFPASLELSDLDGSNGFTLNLDGGYFIGLYTGGKSVSEAGDINGDGIDDLIVGAYRADRPNGSGQSYVVFGSDEGFDASLELTVLDGSNGFVINGISAGDFSGDSVSGAGDINGDGFDDLIIGALYADPNGESSGQSYVVFGSNEGFSASLELSELDGSNGFALDGINPGDFSGQSVSKAGDINGDGLDDLIIGAYGADPNGESSGQSYVVFGFSNPSNPIFNSLNPTPITGTESNDGVTGTEEDDELQGLAGNDALDGGAGNDILDGGSGTDTAVYQFAPAGVTVDLDSDTANDGFGDIDTLINIENIIGSEFDDTLSGDDGVNSLTGRDGDDLLDGGGGNDFLTGSTGADVMTGGGGADRFLYLSPSESGDTIEDFEDVDTISLVGSVFSGGLSPGGLPASQFFVGTEATDVNQRFGYDSDTGDVFFDEDGLGGADAIVLATLSGTSEFTNSDIVII